MSTDRTSDDRTSSHPVVRGPTRWLFLASFAGALAVSATLSLFFLWGLLDESISSFNIGLWLAVMALAVGIPVLGRHLRTRGRIGLAIAVLSVLALPGLLYVLFALLLIATVTRWN
jgi:hypothetical protein